MQPIGRFSRGKQCPTHISASASFQDLGESGPSYIDNSKLHFLPLCSVRWDKAKLPSQKLFVCLFGWLVLFFASQNLYCSRMNRKRPKRKMAYSKFDFPQWFLLSTGSDPVSSNTMHFHDAFK